MLSSIGVFKTMAFDENFAEPGSKDVRYKRDKKDDHRYSLYHKFKDEQIEVFIKNNNEFEGYDEFENEEFNVVLISPKFRHELKKKPWRYKNNMKSISKELTSISQDALKLLRSDGTLLVHHSPSVLPLIGHKLNKKDLRFRYWISLKRPTDENYPIQHHHEGILMYFLDENNFHYNIIKEPHKKCQVCDRYLKDWGGKKDQMDPEGSTISDIWDDINFEGYEDNTKLPIKAMDRLLDLVTMDGFKVLLAPFEGDINA